MQGIIETLREEHDEIEKFIEALRVKCIAFMEHNEVNLQDFKDAVQFIRTYADLRHHQKEEKILFKAMLDHLGTVAVNLIQHGMLVEHDLARLHVMELEKAVEAYEKAPTPENKIDIISNAMGYYYLLKRHIAKENEVIYPYAQKSLSAEIMKELDEAVIPYMEEISK
ncbi:MAG: hemerythrin domain-containing protein [Firmicutes bacterium]|uniref:Hemerythrin domain-containing protein n=1 Tax=Candidatus Scybalomonas excrementavium TaxID=2840943 RepID=A0A9D9N766_9FIRM|nr:hemerythrin domain-containing protein [Candidatus Scybalomonas excrementavium]